MNLAINNRKFGEKKDCSQDKLYKLAGSPINTITRIEVGDVLNPTKDMAGKIAESFNVDVGDLVKE